MMHQSPNNLTLIDPSVVHSLCNIIHRASMNARAPQFAEITKAPFPPVYQRFLSFIGIFSFDRGCVVGYPVRRPFRQGSVGILVNDSWKRNVCPPFLRRMGIHWRIYLGSRVAT